MILYMTLDSDGFLQVWNVDPGEPSYSYDGFKGEYFFDNASRTPLIEISNDSPGYDDWLEYFFPKAKFDRSNPLVRTLLPETLDKFIENENNITEPGN